MKSGQAVRALVEALAATGAMAAERAHQSDDPVGRARARAILDGERDPAAQIEILRAAGEEAERWGLRRLPGHETHARVSGAAWVNVGPDNAAFAINGGTILSKIDSGRAKKILPHPTNPDILYFAVSGGGVWKTFNAANPSAQGGPAWLAITESIGSLAVGSLAM